MKPGIAISVVPGVGDVDVAVTIDRDVGGCVEPPLRGGPAVAVAALVERAGRPLLLVRGGAQGQRARSERNTWTVIAG